MNLSISQTYAFPSHSSAKSTVYPPKVGFRGMGDKASSIMGAIDNNRLIELTLSDGLGMVVPRAFLAWSIRGPDDGRETFLRELTGLVCNVALVGLASHLAMNLLGNHVNFYNPQGILASSWINAGHLATFSQLYEQSLQKTQNASEARQHFIHRVLEGLENDDRRFSLENRMANLHELSSYPQSQAKMLHQMLQTVYGAKLTPKINVEYQSLLQQGLFDSLQSRLLEDGWGRLSEKSISELALHFDTKSNPSGTGVSSLDEQAWQAVKDKEKNEIQKAFSKARLKLSLRDQKNLEADFMKTVETMSLHHGLTSVVHLKDIHQTIKQSHPSTLLSHQDLQGLLKGLKHFLEQVVDRAAFEAIHPLEKGLLSSKPPSWAEQKKRIRQRMFLSHSHGWRQFFPQRNDGLVTAILKSKGAYTWLPLGITLGLAGVLTFYNNYYTQKKYGGKVFFPGEMTPSKRAAQETDWGLA